MQRKTIHEGNEIVDIETWKVVTFIDAELEFPIPIAQGKGSLETRARKQLFDLSGGILNANNCMILFEKDEIYDVIANWNLDIKAGDIVRPNLISSCTCGIACYCEIYIPRNVGYCRIIELQNDEGDFVLESLTTGKIFHSGREYWTRVNAFE